jgi:hypothetical protein
VLRSANASHLGEVRWRLRQSREALPVPRGRRRDIHRRGRVPPDCGGGILSPDQAHNRGTFLDRLRCRRGLIPQGAAIRRRQGREVRDDHERGIPPCSPRKTSSQALPKRTTAGHITVRPHKSHGKGRSLPFPPCAKGGRIAFGLRLSFRRTP